MNVAGGDYFDIFCSFVKCENCLFMRGTCVLFDEDISEDRIMEIAKDSIYLEEYIANAKRLGFHEIAEKLEEDVECSEMAIISKKELNEGGEKLREKILRVWDTTTPIMRKIIYLNKMGKTAYSTIKGDDMFEYLYSHRKDLEALRSAGYYIVCTGPNSSTTKKMRTTSKSVCICW